jgi:hypothetical protein
MGAEPDEDWILERRRELQENWDKYFAEYEKRKILRGGIPSANLTQFICEPERFKEPWTPEKDRECKELFNQWKEDYIRRVSEGEELRNKWKADFNRRTRKLSNLKKGS